MKYSIEFTDTAKSDLLNIATYIAEEAKDKEVAKRFVQEISAQCTMLEDFPLSGAIPKDRLIKNSGYRFLIHKDYLIFYTTDEMKNKVYVQSVFNAKKDYMRVLKKLI